MKTAFYLRVSKDEQLSVNQQLVLEAVCARESWPLPLKKHVFVDHGFARTKTRDKRPGLQALWEAIEAREVDFVLVYAIDRIGALKSTVPFMELLKRKHCGLYIDLQRLDTSTPMGAAMMSLWGAIGEIELALMSQRVKAGLARARAAGRFGGSPKLSPEKCAKIRKLRMAKHPDGTPKYGINKIARMVGVGDKPTVRVLREANLA